MNDNGEVEKMTREEADQLVKEAQRLSAEAQAKVDMVEKAKEAGKIVEPKKTAQKPEVQSQTTGNMSELRDRLQTLREDIFKLNTNSSADSGVLRIKLERIEGDVKYIKDYVDGKGEPEKKEGWLAKLGFK